MSDFDIKQILPLLQSMGLSPNQLGPEKLAILQQLAETISDPAKLDTEDASKILRSLGVGKQEPKRSNISKKVKRNENCPCSSGKKYKKCCGV